MKYSRFLPLVTSGLLGAGISASVVGSDSSVRFYNWSDFIAPETPLEFTKETGLPLVIDSFDSAEVMQSKLMAGRSGYDVDKIKAALGENAPVNSWDLVFKKENISKLQSCGVERLLGKTAQSVTWINCSPSAWETPAR